MAQGLDVLSVLPQMHEGRPQGDEFAKGVPVIFGVNARIHADGRVCDSR